MATTGRSRGHKARYRAEIDSAAVPRQIVAAAELARTRAWMDAHLREPEIVA